MCCFPISDFIQVYLDTSGILRDSDLQNLNREERKILDALYRLRNEGLISLLTMQGSLSDIFGDNDEKVQTPERKKAADERVKTMWTRTSPLATTIYESNVDFGDDEIELFNVLFQPPASRDDIYDRYLSLEDNDRNDFTIFVDACFDANNSPYFITSNIRDFCKGGKKDALEKLAQKRGKSLRIREITWDVVEEIKQDIHNIGLMLKGC